MSLSQSHLISNSVSPDQLASALLPRPLHITRKEGSFLFNNAVVLQASGLALVEAQSLAGRLRALTGFPLEILEDKVPSIPRVELLLDATLQELGPEGYRLQISPDIVTIRSAGQAGLFYGGQTLLQLLPPAFETSGEIPCQEIEDRPRFVWRGALLDVVRHFMPLKFVKRFIDLLALHKLNTLQLHLTDDQGWRVEIKKYPRLTEIGGYRKETIVGLATQDPASDAYDISKDRFDGVRHGGYYTQDELRDLVAYAQERHVTIVPEIGMPGHAQAAITAYPELGSTDQPMEVSTTWGIHANLFNPSDYTIQFLRDVLEEVIAIFPSRFIHVGGDEAVKKQWKANPEIQARIHALGLENEEALQGYFLRSVGQLLSDNGRRLIGWDEILEGGLAADSVITSWRGETGGIHAAQAGHDVVMAPYTHTYLDYYQSEDRSQEPQAFPDYLPLDRVYHYEPIPGDLPAEFAHHILGAQGQLWSEYMPTTQQVEYMAFPRLSALAEVLWSECQERDFEAFLQRLDIHQKRLDVLDINYRPARS